MSELSEEEQQAFYDLESIYPYCTADKKDIPKAEWTRLRLWRKRNELTVQWFSASRGTRIGTVAAVAAALVTTTVFGTTGVVTSSEMADNGDTKADGVSTYETARQGRKLALFDLNALRTTGTCALELSVMRSKLRANELPLGDLYPPAGSYDEAIEVAATNEVPCVPASAAPYYVWVHDVPVIVTGNSLVSPFYNVDNLCSGPSDPERNRLEAEINKYPPQTPVRNELQALADQAKTIC